MTCAPTNGKRVPPTLAFDNVPPLGRHGFGILNSPHSRGSRNRRADYVAICELLGKSVAAWVGVLENIGKARWPPEQAYAQKHNVQCIFLPATPPASTILSPIRRLRQPLSLSPSLSISPPSGAWPYFCCRASSWQPETSGVGEKMSLRSVKPGRRPRQGAHPAW